MANRPIQHLVPLEVSDNFEQENDFQIKNGSAKKDYRRPRRTAKQNADLFEICKTASGEPEGHAGGVWT